MALMTYLLRDKNGTYYFRRVVPPTLRPFMAEPWTGKANYKLSLRTKDPKKAKASASKALTGCTEAFEEAERASRGLTKTARPAASFAPLRTEDIEAEVIGDLLRADEAERSDGDARRQHQTGEERQQWPDLVPVAFGRKGMAPEHHLVYGDELAELAHEYRTALSRLDPDIVDAELRTYLKARRIAIDPLSDTYRQYGLAVLTAHVRGFELMLDRQAGAIVSPPLKVNRGPKLSEAFASWKAGGTARGSKRPASNTVREAEHAFRRFKEWHGDLCLGEIDKLKAREFRDALAKVPTRLPRELGTLGLRDVLRRDLSRYPAAHAGTINKSLTLLSAIISHAMGEGRMDHFPYSNPFTGIKLKLDDRADDTRSIFDTGDLQAIFESPIYSAGKRPIGGGGEAAYWLPLIALFTGARQGEIAQLRIEDLKQDPQTGVWFFDIGTGGGRSIKTASSRRRVPVHPHLVKIGLLRYHRSLQGTAAKFGLPLWHAMPSDGARRPAAAWSQWFNRYLRQTVKIEVGGKVFHSFRHTFKRMARDAGLPEELHDALTGHSGGGVGRGYGGGFGLQALADAMSRIEVPTPARNLAWMSV